MMMMTKSLQQRADTQASQGLPSLTTHASCTLPLSHSPFHRPLHHWARRSRLFFFVSTTISLERVLFQPSLPVCLSYSKILPPESASPQNPGGVDQVSQGIQVCFLPRLRLIKGKDKNLLSTSCGTLQSAWHAVGTQPIQGPSFFMTDSCHRCQ